MTGCYWEVFNETAFLIFPSLGFCVFLEPQLWYVDTTKIVLEGRCEFGGGTICLCLHRVMENV